MASEQQIQDLLQAKQRASDQLLAALTAADPKAEIIQGWTTLLKTAEADLDKAQGLSRKRSADQANTEADRAKSQRTTEGQAPAVQPPAVRAAPARSVGFSNDDYHWTVFFPGIKDHEGFWHELSGGIQTIAIHKNPKGLDIRPKQLQRETQLFLWRKVRQVWRKMESQLVLGNEASHVLRWWNVIQEVIHYLPQGPKTVSEIADPVSEKMIVEAPAEGGSSASSAPQYRFTTQKVDHEGYLHIPSVLKGHVELQLSRYMETAVAAPQQQSSQAQPAAVRLNPVKVGALEAAASLENSTKLKNKISQSVKEGGAFYYLNTEEQGNSTQNLIRMIVADGTHLMMVVIQFNSTWTKGMSSRDYQGTVSASPSYTLESSADDTCLQAVCLLADWLYTGSKRLEELTVADLETAGAQKDAGYSAGMDREERAFRDFWSHE